MDVEQLKAALEGAAEAGLPAAEVQPATELSQKLSLYYSVQNEAFSGRDVEKTRQCVVMSEELGLAGPKEKQASYLLKALQEEARVKKILADAMAKRDLAGIRHALQVAMTHKSGLMVDSALQKAMASGLADDPIIKQAQEMEKTLIREVV